MDETLNVRGCCSFGTFLDAFTRAAARRGVPLVLVDRRIARRDWRAGLTGGEALEMQRKALHREAPVIAMGSSPSRNNGG